MKLIISIGLLAGLALFTILIAYQGIGQATSILITAKWNLVIVILFHLLPMTADSIAWRTLLNRTHRPRFRTFLRARWIGESINTLLPVAQVGGELVRARLLAHHKVPTSQAGASVVVNLTLMVFAQIVFTLLGLALLILFLGVDEGKLIQGILIGAVLIALFLVGFYWLQRHGLFGWLARRLRSLIGSSKQLNWMGGAAALDTSIVQLYNHRQRVLCSFSWSLLGWILGTGEAWLALYFLGHPVGWLEAFMIESLAQAVKGAAFLIPGALGVLEGGYILLGTLVGLPPSVGLALALTRRVRELSLGVPGLLVWQLSEGKRLLSIKGKISARGSG